MNDTDSGKRFPFPQSYWLIFANPVKYFKRKNVDGRSCTDLPCLFVFIAFVCVWAYTALYAFRTSNLRNMVVPIDGIGRRCSIEYEVRSRPDAHYFDLRKCISFHALLYGCSTNRVCNKECLDNKFVFDLATCKKSYSDYYDIIRCGFNQKFPKDNNCTTIVQYIEKDKCAGFHFPSKSIFQHCIPWENMTDSHFTTDYKKSVYQSRADETSKAIRKAREFYKIIEKIYDDAANTWLIVLNYCLFAAIPCVLAITHMHRIAKPLLWGSIFTVLVASGIGSIYCLTEYQRLKDGPAPHPIDVASLDVLAWIKSIRDDVKTWIFLGSVSSVVCIIMFSLFLVIRNRVTTAVALVKEGSEAVISIWSSVLFPILPWATHAAVIVFAFYVAINLKSVILAFGIIDRFDKDCKCTGPASHYKKVGDKCEQYTYYKYCKDKHGNGCGSCFFKGLEFPHQVPYMQAFNLVALVWSLLILAAIFRTILASTFATWYWTFDKKKVPSSALANGIYRILRYHLGTMVFGSITIGIFSYARVILAPIDWISSKFYTDSTNQPENIVSRCIYTVFGMPIWAYTQLSSLLDTDAYFICAMRGKGLVSSGRYAYFLAMRNASYAAKLRGSTGLLFLMTNMLVSFAVGSTAYGYFALNKFSLELNYVATPVILILIGTFMISSSYVSIFSVAFDTMTICFLEDCEQNDGSRRKPYFMSKRLMQIFGNKNIDSPIVNESEEDVTPDVLL